MAAPGAGPVFQRGGRIGWTEGSIRHKDPVVIQTFTAAICAVPDHNGTYVCGSPQVHLPPCIGITISMADGAVGEIAVGVSVDRFPSAGGVVTGKRAALR